VDFEHRNYQRFIRIESWVAAAIFFFGLLALFSEAGDDAELKDLGAREGMSRFVSYYVVELVQIAVIYLSFLILNFKVVPALIRKDRIWLHVGVIVAIFFAFGIAFGRFDTGFGPLAVFGIYTIVKYSFLYVWNNADRLRTRFRFLAPGVMLAIPLWVLSVIFFSISDAHADTTITWSIIILSGIVMYSYAFIVLIPQSYGRKKPFLFYIVRFAIIILVAQIAIGFIGALVTSDEDMPFAIVVMNTFFLLFFIAPLSWIVYKRSETNEERISSLEKELGQSTANFDFLRSQINPHFLFNALNTLYGTAIQENSERTAEGIQKLGDMMRFMLQENMQEKISLTREIDYLTNYISLQKLRTDATPTIAITADIEQSVQLLQIAPMLLIPFVENAFKHGISFREPSYIKMSLYTKEKVLYFDVSNSIHRKADNDPEKDKSGIGLNNVKQRLKLLYPDKHELIIRESPREFFVHLSIILS
jgi:two-component system, LytTR family, sensor kinase